MAMHAGRPPAAPAGGSLQHVCSREDSVRSGRCAARAALGRAASTRAPVHMEPMLRVGLFQG